MTRAPHAFWQTLDPPGTYAESPGTVYHTGYPASLPDGRQLLLPIRDLPGGAGEAVASLIINQASFAVEDALADAMAALWRDAAPEVVVGVPTLGLPLVNALARRLGHARKVPLSTSRKFWYSDDLSEPLKSITSPGGGKTLYLDPRMLPLLEGRRVLVVDDVVSTGSSLSSVLRLLEKAQVTPFGIAVAMEQSTRWRQIIPDPDRVKGAIRSPILQKTQSGYVVAADATKPTN